MLIVTLVATLILARLLVPADFGVFAVGLLAYPMYTNLYQGRLQSKLAIQFKKAETKQHYVAGETAIGDPITKISIPAADLKPTVVVEGTGASALRAGALAASFSSDHKPVSAKLIRPSGVTRKSRFFRYSASWARARASGLG